MDTTDPNIKFEQDGTCNHCNSNLNNISSIKSLPANDETNIASLFNQLKQTKSKYDCVIGLSGGVDSCYTVYLAKKYNLNPLLVHLDNSWNTNDAKNNFKKLAELFNFDLSIVKLDEKEYREVQLAFLKSGIVDFELAFDIAIQAVLFDEAKKNGVKAILSGGNYASEGILPLAWGYHPFKDHRLYAHIIKKYCSLIPKKIPTFGLWKEIYLKMVVGIKIHYPLNLIHYNKTAAKRTLESELGLVFPVNKHHESRFTRFWQAFVVPQKFGFDYRLTTLSSQICSQQITRDEALETLTKEKTYEFDVEAEKKQIANQLNISLTEFEELLATPPKVYTDFPNNKRIIELVHNIYFKLFKRK
jgi:N-acetyl sugar amidotransferase